jgi:peptide/nickel transport system permease protein
MSGIDRGLVSTAGSSPAQPLPPSGIVLPRQLAKAVPLRPGLVLAVLFLALLVCAAAFPGALAPIDPLATDPNNVFAAPSTAHLLGTDENGRDVFSRLVHATRPSLLLGLSAALLTTGIGSFIGLLAGLSPRWLDNVLMRFSDILQSFPEILLVLVVITFWGASLLTLLMALGVIGLSRCTRQVRAQTLLLRRAPFVEAAITLGLPRWRVVLRHVLPNATKGVLVLLPIEIGWKITTVATLSFLGLGAPPPAPDWGGMLAIDRDYVLNAWWVTAAAAVMLTATVLSVTTLGRELVRRSEGRS